MLVAVLCAGSSMYGAAIPGSTDPQKRVTRLEYFYDQDPGFGNGVAVEFDTDAQGRIQKNLNLPLDGLSVGMHHLFVRALNGRGEWSIAYKHTFFVTPFAAQTVPIIEKGEYFFGEDPGKGNGTTVLPGNPSGGGVAFSIQPPPMQPGHHTLQFRSQDSFGNWSMPLKHAALQLPDIRVTGVEWSVLEDEETIDSGMQPVNPPASRFSGELNTSLLPDETFIERPFQAQARLILEERIPTVLQSFDLEIQALAEPLSIITPPRSQTVSVGDRFSLSVAVEGTGEKTFQWFHNDQPIAGADGADLVLSNVQLADAGSYYVKIEGIIGNLQSQTAILTVNDPNPPVGEIVYHPADSNQDGRIVIGEVTAYGAAWKRGDTWPTEPNPIPISYLTRAGALWKGGEAYEKDANVAQPPLWWVNPPQSARALSVFTPSVHQNKVERQLDESSARIDVQPAVTTQVYAVQETIPVGFKAIRISHGGVFDARRNQIRWGPFMDHQSRSLSFELSGTNASAGYQELRGIASFDGVDRMIISKTAWTDQGDDGPKLKLLIDPHGMTRFTVAGEIGATYHIESTDSLENEDWNLRGILTMEHAEQFWEDGEASVLKHRFYRIKALDPVSGLKSESF